MEKLKRRSPAVAFENNEAATFSLKNEHAVHRIHAVGSDVLRESQKL